MRPRPRIRRTIKWGGAAVLFGLTVAFGLSWVYQPHVTIAPGRSITLRPASVMFYALDPPRPDQFERRRQVFAGGPFYRWKPGWYVTPGTTLIDVPLWMLIAATAVPTALAWVTDRRASKRVQQGCCWKCNYDRSGLAAQGVCPECGATPKAPSPA